MDVVQLLLEHGADTSLVARSGRGGHTLVCRGPPINSLVVEGDGEDTGQGEVHKCLPILAALES